MAATDSIILGLFGDTLVLFAILVLSGHLLAKRSPAHAARQTLLVCFAWVAVLVGLAAIAEALSVTDGLLALLTHREASEAFDTTPVFDAPTGYLHAQSLCVLLALATNVAWARLSRARYLFLNPLHVLLGTSLLLALFAHAHASPWLAVPFVGVGIGSAAAWMPYLAEKHFGLAQEGFALGTLHTLLFAGTRFTAAQLKGGPHEAKGSWTKPDAPHSPLLFAAVLIGSVAAVVALLVGPQGSATVLQGATLLQVLPAVGATFYAVGAFFLGVQVAVGLWILLQALPLVMSTTLEAFRGFEKLLPDCKPALDGIFLLPQAPRAAAAGFLLSLLGAVLGYYLAVALGLQTSVPGVLAAMTAGGVAGVIAERTGGRRGLLAATPLHGFALSLLVAALATASATPVSLELSDASTLGTVLALVLRPFS